MRSGDSLEDGCVRLHSHRKTVLCCDVEMRSRDKVLTPVDAGHLDGLLAPSICRSPYVSERERERLRLSRAHPSQCGCSGAVTDTWIIVITGQSRASY